VEELSLGNAVSAAPSRWQTLDFKVSDRVLAEILDGGQAFRWNRIDAEMGTLERPVTNGRQRKTPWTGGSRSLQASSRSLWKGIWDRHVVVLRRGPDGVLAWQAHTETTANEVTDYLGEARAWTERTDQLPWRSDAVMTAAIRRFPGLRILRQPLGETLLAFLCSSTKQIVQIKAMMELLAERFGDRLSTGDHALPTWRQLAAVGEAHLRACKLGYRARYVAATAEALAAQPDWEETVHALPYPEAHAWLCRLPGVGAKVADCVLLFGAAKLEAFPVDTWILKVLARAYGLEHWTPAQLATFGRIHFGPHAGLAQQYLFAWARDGFSRA
jgi:N-glycosylase/DNA lyase